MQVTYIQHCGEDDSVVNAARVSFHKLAEQFTGEQNAKLIRYLATHKHFSPFNHSFLTLHVKAPIFVARQLVKHKFMPLNEVSRRYVTDDPEFYIPERWRMAAENKKQGSSEEAFEIDKAYRDKFNTRVDQSITNRKLTNWRNGAKRKGREFNLEHNDIPWVRYCPILNIELDYAVEGHGNCQDNSPSLDRIDNNLGYVKGNVEVVSKLANTMKSSATPEQIKSFIKSMAPRYGIFNVGANSVEEYYETMKDLYRRLIEGGMCPEQARGFMPLSMYTEWYWSGTLGAWADMYNLRAKPDAQWETQQIALKCGEIIQPLFPVSWEALTHV